MNTENDRTQAEGDQARTPHPPAETAELHRLGLVPEAPGPDHDARHDHALAPDHHFKPGPQHSHPAKRDVL